MINNVTDLKRRTMMESNILKSIILSSTDDSLPSRDDILIHDYQIANSVTINSILSNFIVNLKYAWNRLSNDGSLEKESYFQIVDSLKNSKNRLDDETRMVMEVVNGKGTFKSRRLVLFSKKVDLDENVVSFHCLDSVWYGKQRLLSEKGHEYDKFVVVDGMNDFYINPNPYGTNIFDAPMEYGDHDGSFNSYAADRAQTSDFHVGSVNENLFYHNAIGDDTGFSHSLSSSRYILCMDNGLYGLEPVFDRTGEFASTRLHDMGSFIQNLDSDQYGNREYVFKSCSFQVVGGQTSLIVVVAEAESGVQHYLFLNEDSYDDLYGFRQIDSVVTDGLVVDSQSVFTNVEAVRQLDNVCIALTNYGFWDVEPNTTNYVTYSYRDRKTYVQGVGYGNALKTKIVRPEFPVPEGGRIFEYDKVWTHDVSNSTWSCDDFGTPSDPETVSYLDKIKSPSGNYHHFAGATDSFAIYNSTETEPAYIVPGMTYDQFRELIFSSGELLSDFLDYFYLQSVESTFGEFYLKNNHARFCDTLNGLMSDVTFSNMKYSANGNDLVDGKFDNVLSLAQFDKEHSTWTLHDYCHYLNQELDPDQVGISWLIKTGETQSYLTGQMDGYFREHEYDAQKDSLQRKIVDGIVSAHPLLGHFQEYLMEHVGSHLSSCPEGGIEPDAVSLENVVSSVKDLIRSQVMTALILKDGNYEGIQSYLHHHTTSITKNEIKNIMSMENIKNQMVLSVKSTPFFNDSHTYLQLKNVLDENGDDGLFNLKFNRHFAEKSNLLDNDGNIKVNWDQIRNFLYPQGEEEIPLLDVVHAFIRTQFYRPLYFKHDNYTDFTRNENVYRCETRKFYQNHDYEQHELKFNGQQIDLSESGLSPSGLGYSIKGVEYVPLDNYLRYTVEYDPIAIRDDKFVYQGVEHYVKRSQDGRISNVLFNQFQKEIQSQCKEVSIDQNGRFTLNGKQYQIETNGQGKAVRISVDSATSAFEGDKKEFKCEVVDDMFRVEGIWYALEREGQYYIGLSYARVDDNRLLSVPVDQDSGICNIQDRGLTFRFYSSSADGEWDRVSATFDYSTEVIDRVVKEWCEFDDVSSSDPQSSYEWYIANRITQLASANPNVRNLGDGILYQGGLDTTRCTLKLAHEVQGGEVVSKCVLRKKVGDEPATEQYLGVLYDKNMRIVGGKVLYGRLDQNGIFQEDPSGDVFIMIDTKGKRNNTNLVWVDRQTWTSNVSVVKDVGTVTTSETDGTTLVIDFGLKAGYPEFLTMKLVETTKDNSITYNWYQVSPNPDGSGKYRVRQTGDVVYAFAEGVRYAINTRTGRVNSLKFNEMSANTMDFSTQYTLDQLRDNLLNNLKQYMMNQIVNDLICNGDLEQIEFNPSFHMVDKETGVELPDCLYLDMFPDETSLSHFTTANSIQDSSDPRCRKFLEVFKNNAYDIDDSDAYLGKVNQFLQSKISNTFGNGNSLVVLDIDTITPELMDGSDTFSYEVLFNLHLMQNKDLVKNNKTSYADKWIIGDLTVKNLRCKVTFTPVYTPTAGGTPGSMKYRARYLVTGYQDGKCNVNYDQIVYCVNGKVKKKAIPTRTCTGVAIQQVEYSDQSLKDISQITEETLSREIENLFTHNEVQSQFIAINNQIGTEDLVVDTESRKNPKSAGNSQWVYGEKWELDEQMPPESELPGRLVYMNRGNLLIDGDVYNVVAVEEEGQMKDKYIEQNEGPGRFDLVQMDVHVDGDEQSENYNSESNIQKKHVAKGDVIVPKSDVEQLFSINNLGNSVYMKFKTNDYSFLFPSIAQDNFTFRLSDVQHIDELVKQLSGESLISLPDESNNDPYWHYLVKEASYANGAITIQIREDIKDQQGTTQTVPGSQKTITVPNATTCLLLDPPGASTEQGMDISAIGNDLTSSSYFTLKLDDTQILSVNEWIENGLSDTFELTYDIPFSGFFNKEEEQETQSGEDGGSDEPTGEGAGEPDSPVSESDEVDDDEDEDDDDDIDPENPVEDTEDNGGETPPTPPEIKTSGWFGIEGSFSVRIRLSKDEDGSISIDPEDLTSAVITSVTKGTCRSFTGIPSKDTNVGEELQGTTIYTLVQQDENEAWQIIGDNRTDLSIPLVDAQLDITQATSNSGQSGNDEGDDEGVETSEEPETPAEETNGEDEDNKIASLSIKFKVNAKTVSQTMAIMPDSNTEYIASDVVIGNRGAPYVNGILLMSDFLGNPVGTLDYGYVSYPMNLQEISQASGSTIDDIQYKTTYFKLNSSRTAIESDGLYCPFAVHVIGPDETSDQDGDIYNRFYEVSLDVVAHHSDIDASHADDGNFWMDKAGTLKSINRTPNHLDYKKLTFELDSQGSPMNYHDESVPERLREDVQKLVDSKCRLDDDYFNSVLVQLRQFLNTVFDELEGGIDMQGLLNLCVFDYDKKVSFTQHSGEWDDLDGGMFGYQRAGNTYATCRENFNNYLKGEFKGDFSSLKDVDDVLLYDDPNTPGGDANKRRNYNHILKPYDTLKEGIEGRYSDWSRVDGNSNRLLTVLNRLRDTILRQIYQCHGNPNPSLIDEVFSQGNRETVRYLAAVPMNVTGEIKEMFVADGYCNLIHKSGDDLMWSRFVSSRTSTSTLLDRKFTNGLDFVYEIQMMDVFGITDRDWAYRFGNRDLSITSTISDQFFIHCYDREKGDMWYHSEIGGYVYSSHKIVDMAYEQHGNSTYVLFEGDNRLYRYDNLDQLKDFDNCILLQKENATMKIETRHSTKISGKTDTLDLIFLDYTDPRTWTVDLYGTFGAGNNVIESWANSPGSSTHHFEQYNNVMFGDTLFDSNQLKFQNISKNKEMFDILDIYEVDGNYYGMFKDETNRPDQEETPTEETYTVFRSGFDTEVVQKMPYQIVNPTFYRSIDDLYSLFVVERIPYLEQGNYLTTLREISVPDSDLYPERVIYLDDVISRPEGVTEPFEVKDVIMQQFRPHDSRTSFFVLSNWGFYKVGYTNRFRRISIDTLDELKTKLWNALQKTTIQKHIAQKHEGAEQSEYFNQMSQKVNQFSSDFDVFSLIPAEFGETQDVGVIPEGKIDDTDRDSDHRPDSVLMSTDILPSQGMVAQKDTNPGMVTCAVQNPDTNYGSNPNVMKSQRNPLIEGTGFYDYMYDSDGNVLMDLYQIPFIYQVNSNNTYDLYINVPTTRTKYLNRITGTLKPDGTSQVLPEDSRARRNFQNSSLPNNLNESTTRLRVYIDRKFISVGNVELVEISGNSIPLQIYRDTVNNGLYDSIALEGRWDGEVVWINQHEKDINKVMLEFEIYGTDSQSIHIQGKTIVNRALDDKKYIFA